MSESLGNKKVNCVINEMTKDCIEGLKRRTCENKNCWKQKIKRKSIFSKHEMAKHDFSKIVETCLKHKICCRIF